MKNRKARSLVLVGATIVAIGWAVQRPEAIIINGGKQAHFGPLSLTRGQSFRFYLANTEMPDGDMMPCVADVMIYNAMGDMVGQSRHSVGEGETQFFDLMFDDLLGGRSDAMMNKMVFRLAAQLVSGPVDMCVATAEIFDMRTGRTEVFLGGPDTIPAPTM